jgi:hypothetical protein
MRTELARLYIPRWWIEHRIRDGNSSPQPISRVARAYSSPPKGVKVEDWNTDFAKTAAILPCPLRLERNQCGFCAGGRLSGFAGAWRCSICFC